MLCLFRLGWIAQGTLKSDARFRKVLRRSSIFGNGNRLKIVRQLIRLRDRIDRIRKGFQPLDPSCNLPWECHCRSDSNSLRHRYKSRLNNTRRRSGKVLNSLSSDMRKHETSTAQHCSRFQQRCQELYHSPAQESMFSLGGDH